MPSLDLPKLPRWNDPGSVASFLGAVLTMGFGVVSLVHPGLHEPAIAVAVIPPVALLVAIGAITVNVLTHRKAHTTVASALAGAGLYPDLTKLAAAVEPLVTQVDPRAVAEDASAIALAKLVLHQGAVAP